MAEPFERDGVCSTCGRATLGDALLRACLYLDGFIWVDEPEASELEEIREVVRRALGCKTWEQTMELAQLRDVRRGEA